MTSISRIQGSTSVLNGAHLTVTKNDLGFVTDVSLSTSETTALTSFTITYYATPINYIGTASGESAYTVSGR